MPAQRDKEGVYHLVGDMVVAPKEMFLHSLKISLPLLKSAGSHQKVILSPLPRFLTASCCDGPGHVKNRDDTEFGEKLLDDLVVLKRQIKDFCHINHLGGISSLTLRSSCLVWREDGSLLRRRGRRWRQSGDLTRSTQAKADIRGWQPTSWADYKVFS